MSDISAVSRPLTLPILTDQHILEYLDEEPTEAAHRLRELAERDPELRPALRALGEVVMRLGLVGGRDLQVGVVIDTGNVRRRCT